MSERHLPFRILFFQQGSWTWPFLGWTLPSFQGSFSRFHHDKKKDTGSFHHGSPTTFLYRLVGTNHHGLKHISSSGLRNFKWWLTCRGNCHNQKLPRRSLKGIPKANCDARRRHRSQRRWDRNLVQCRALKREMFYEQTKPQILLVAYLRSICFFRYFY